MKLKIYILYMHYLDTNIVLLVLFTWQIYMIIYDFSLYDEEETIYGRALDYLWNKTQELK